MMTQTEHTEAGLRTESPAAAGIAHLVDEGALL